MIPAPCPRCGVSHVYIPTRPMAGRLVEAKDRTEDFLAAHPITRMACELGAVAGFVLFAFQAFAMFGG